MTSIDAGGGESQPSLANRFTMVQQVESGEKAFLEVGSVVQHGKILEVSGRTEPGSSVIINNEQVFSIVADGNFHHFMSQPARSGVNQITVTAQNRKGELQEIFLFHLKNFYSTEVLHHEALIPKFALNFQEVFH